MGHALARSFSCRSAVRFPRTWRTGWHQGIKIRTGYRRPRRRHSDSGVPAGVGAGGGSRGRCCNRRAGRRGAVAGRGGEAAEPGRRGVVVFGTVRAEGSGLPPPPPLPPGYFLAVEELDPVGLDLSPCDRFWPVALSVPLCRASGSLRSWTETPLLEVLGAVLRSPIPDRVTSMKVTSSRRSPSLPCCTCGSVAMPRFEHGGCRSGSRSASSGSRVTFADQEDLVETRLPLTSTLPQCPGLGTPGILGPIPLRGKLNGCSLTAKSTTGSRVGAIEKSHKAGSDRFRLGGTGGLPAEVRSAQEAGGSFLAAAAAGPVVHRPLRGGPSSPSWPGLEVMASFDQ